MSAVFYWRLIRAACLDKMNILKSYTKFVYVLAWSMLTFITANTWPALNWDIIPYTASAYEIGGLHGIPLRDATFMDVAKVIPSDKFTSMTSTSDTYRAVVYHDASALEQQLPFYRIRYAYNWLVYTVGTTLGSFAKSTILVSSIAGALIVAVSGNIFPPNRSLFGFFLFPPLVMLVGAHKLATLSTPDALASLFAILLFVTLLNRSVYIAALLICVLPAFRTDYLIISVASCVYLFANKNKALAAISAAICTTVYIMINYFSKNYGHMVIFNFTLINGPHPFPTLMPISTDFGDYAAAYIRGLKHVFSQPLPYLTAITAALLLYLKKRFNHDNRIKSIFIISLFFVVVHFALFPAAFSRLYFVLQWTTCACLIEAYVTRRGNPPPQ